MIDHGSGLAPYETERVFEAFQRGPGTAGVRGAGLGLAIARGFAEANGGRVWAESRRGRARPSCWRYRSSRRRRCA